MRKFKLIKQYPARDHEGIIAIQKTPDGMYEGWEYNYYAKHVENNPEYWEEVFEPTYQIISYVAKDCDIVIIKQSEYPSSLDGLPNDYWKIHSVKRLSDGEIFTIGDKAKTINSNGRHTVTRFKIRQRCTGTDSNGKYTYDGIDAIWIDWERDCGGNWLESTEKIEQPIPITEDGVQVYSYDSVQHWVINGDYEYAIGLCKPNADLLRDQPETYKVFSTEAAAKEYVTKNTPLLITEDGIKLFKGDRYFVVHSNWNITKHNIFNSTQDQGYKRFAKIVNAQHYINYSKSRISVEDFLTIAAKWSTNS